MLKQVLGLMPSACAICETPGGSSQWLMNRRICMAFTSAGTSFEVILHVERCSLGKSIAYIVILRRGSSCGISPDAAAAKHPSGIPGPVVRKCLHLVSLDLALGGGPCEIVDHLEVARQLEAGQFGGGPAQQRQIGRAHV